MSQVASSKVVLVCYQFISPQNVFLFKCISVDVRGLDLSSNLLSKWEAIAEITRELPLLRRLSLKCVINSSRGVDAKLVALSSRNRLQPPSNFRPLDGAFQNLTDLQLNATFLSWTEMQTITSNMPKLQLIEMGYNCLSRLSDGMIRPHDCNIQVINLDTNNCSDWVHLCASFSEYHSYVIACQIVCSYHYHLSSLQRIVLTSNRISLIPFPAQPEDSLLAIKYLSLSNNLLNAWSDIDALSCWFPTLETLTISNNPIANGDDPHIASSIYVNLQYFLKTPNSESTHVPSSSQEYHPS